MQFRRTSRRQHDHVRARASIDVADQDPEHAAGMCQRDRSGQFDDLEGPGFKILMDDDGPDIPTSVPSGKDESGKV